MGRIRREIQVDGLGFWVLFDSGARNTYVVPDVAKLLATRPVPPRQAALGGRRHPILEACMLIGSVEGRAIDTDAYVIDMLGEDEEGREIQVLFGALAMQKWGIRLVPEEERVDWSHYPQEFVEF
jgi:hypothetical protein